MRTKSTAMVAAGAVLALGLTACGSGSSGGDPSSLTIMVGGLDKQIYLPAKLAEELGYYKEQGLDVHLANEPAGVNAETALVAGQVQGAVGFYDHNLDLQGKGKSTESVVQMLQVPGEVELCRTDLKGTIDSPADWGHGEKTRLGITQPGSSTDFLTRYLAEKNGVSPDDVSRVGVKAGNTFIAAMQHKSISCGMTTVPTVTQLLDSKQAYPIVDTRTLQGAKQALGGAYPASCLYMSTEYVKSHQKTVQKLVNAYVKTMHWIHTHSAKQIADKMPKEYYKGSGKKAYVHALDSEKGIYTSDGMMPEGGPETVKRVLSEFDPNVKGHDIDLSKTYTTKFVKEAKQKYGY